MAMKRPRREKICSVIVPLVFLLVVIFLNPIEGIFSDTKGLIRLLKFFLALRKFEGEPLLETLSNSAFLIHTVLVLFSKIILVGVTSAYQLAIA